MPRKIARAFKKMEIEKIKNEPIDMTDEELEIALKVINSSAEAIQVSVDRLRFDTKYQVSPEFEPGRLRKLYGYLKDRGGYDAKMGIIHANKRADGFWWVIDGYGRFWMATQLVKPPLKKMDVIPYEGLTLNQEMAIFKYLNRNKRNIKKPRMFMVAAKSGEEPQKSILKIIEEAEFAIDRGVQRSGAILGPESLLFAYSISPEVMKRALFIIKNVWGDKGVHGQHLVAMTAVLYCYPTMDEKRLRHVLKDFNGKSAFSEARIAAQAVLKEGTRNPQPRDSNPIFAKKIVAWYNAGYRHRKLDKSDLEKVADKVPPDLMKEVWNPVHAA